MEAVKSQIRKLSREESKVLRALLYFDIFNHPLTAKEIFENSSLEENERVETFLANLVDAGFLYFFNSFYTLKNQPELIENRIKGNNLAKVFLKRARWVSRLLSWFPFVRGVFISGSLSKNYMNKGTDIDYFIVTAKGRLWICRTLLAILRKLMIGPLKKYFCINYFVTEDSLRIPDENYFTATELAFVYPTYNRQIYETLMEENSWIRQYYPNKPVFLFPINSRTYHLSLKHLFEFLLSGSLGEKLDTYLFKFMLRRWKKRYREDFDETEFELNIRTKKNVSKQHEKGFQFVILQKYKQNIVNFETNHQVKLCDD